MGVTIAHRYVLSAKCLRSLNESLAKRDARKASAKAQLQHCDTNTSHSLQIRNAPETGQYFYAMELSTA